MKRYYETGEYAGGYYVSELYDRDGSVRRRFWFAEHNSKLVYAGGMSYVNKRRPLKHNSAPSNVTKQLREEFGDRVINSRP